MPSVGFRQAVFLQEDTYESRQCQLYFLYVQKKKVISLQQQIGDLQNKNSILEKQELAAEQYNDSLRQEANTVHLYAALSLEETRKASIKEKQSQIIRSSEHILELLNNEKA